MPNSKQAPKKTTGVHRSRKSLRSLLLSRSTLLVLVLILVADFLGDAESIKTAFPMVVTAELKFHRFMSKIDLPKRVRNVTVVIIDDAAHYNLPELNGRVTSRKYLAGLVHNAAAADPLVIGVDFLLLKQHPTGDESVQDEEEGKFLEEIHRASDNRIPVVLAAFQNPVGTEMRNFFNEKHLPPFVSIGTVNLPNDTRQIPLAGDVYVASDANQQIVKSRRSFALAIADASDMDTATTPRTSEEPTIKNAIKNYEFVYGGFVPEKYLEPVTVRSTDLMLKRPKAMNLCHHRVVIIGGAWHRYPNDNNPRDLNDTQESPLGYVPSVYLQADYVEALLSDHYQAAAPVVGEADSGAYLRPRPLRHLQPL